MAKPAERFPVPSDVCAHIRYGADPAEIPIRVIDFSTTGVGFEMENMPRSRAPVVVVMASGSQRLELSAVIKWSAPQEDGPWRVGCQFSKGIGTPQMFGTEANRGACDVPVQVSCQEGPVRGGEATIVDHSPGGIGLLAEFAPQPGSQLMVTHPETGVRFIATVQWWSKDKSGSFIGCQFARSGDLMEFRKLLPPQPSNRPVPQQTSSEQPAAVSSAFQEPTRESQETETPTGGLWAGCALIYGWVLLYWAGGWPP